MSQRPNVVDFYDLEVLPIVLTDPRGAFPEFDFQLRRNGWEAGPGASQEVIDYFGARPDRIMLSKNKPGLIVVAGGTARQLTAYVMGSFSTPRDEQFVKAVGMISDRAGVDTTPINGAKMTQQELADRQVRMEALRIEAEERKEQLKQEQLLEDQRMIRLAMNYAVKARDWSNVNGAQLAIDYFNRRGVRMGLTPGTLPPLPQGVLCIGNAGFKDRPDVSAVVFPMLDEDDCLTAVQRIAVTGKGKSAPVEIDGKLTTKAVLGRAVGSRFTIGEHYVEQMCIITEGGETGMAIHVATGHRIECGMTAQGIEEIKLRKVDIDRKKIRRIIIAGDLDKKGRGQEATRIAADRLRTLYKIPVVELLPTCAAFPELVGEDELPINGKSVDFDDVHRECGAERLADFIDDSVARATVKLQHAPKDEEKDDDGANDEPPFDGGDEGGFSPKPEPKLIMPMEDLDAAHEYLMSRHLPEKTSCTTLMEMSGRIYRWGDGVHMELGERKVLHGDIRRAFRPYRMRKPDGTNPNGTIKFVYPPARLSKNKISAICDAVADEVAVLVQQDDFRTQFWTTNNIKRDGEFDIDTPAWDRRIEDHIRANLPDPSMLLSVEDGLLDLNEWIEHNDLTLLPHTPRFFTQSKIDIVLPIEAANKALEGGVDALEAFARTLCPDFIKFLEVTFHDDEDEEAAPVTIRELMKVVGYYMTEDLTHHNGNIAWFHGSSGTGKSTLMKVICALLGKRMVVSSNMYKISSQFHLASWISKRLAVFADLDQGSRADKTSNVEIFKLIATGEPMSVDRKHRDEIPNHVMKTRLLCLVNQMPHMPDPSNSLMRRSICFDFKNIPDKDKLDPMLETKMTTPESLAGILLLAIVGLSHLKADGGFIQPEWSSEPLEQLAEQSSDYPDFIEQCVEITNEKTINEGDYKGDFASAEDIYDSFCGYLTSVGTKHHPKRHRMLSELIPMLVASKPMGWKKVKQGRVTLNGKASPKGYRGLKLTEVGESFARAHRGESDDAGDQTDGFIPS